MGRIPRHRVLCLHGRRANPLVTELQTGHLRFLLRDVAEFTFLAGPIEVLEPADEAVASASPPPYFEWWRDGAGLEAQEAAALHVAEHMRRHGPFDVVMGFSQGAAVTTLLAAGLEQAAAGLSPKFADIQLPRLIVSVCGVRPGQDPAPLQLIPSVHVIGFQDVYKDESEALLWTWYAGGPEALGRLCVGAKEIGPVEVLYHGQGHRFPKDACAMAEAVRERLLAETQRCAPSAQDSKEDLCLSGHWTMFPAGSEGTVPYEFDHVPGGVLFGGKQEGTLPVRDAFLLGDYIEWKVLDFHVRGKVEDSGRRLELWVTTLDGEYMGAYIGVRDEALREPSVCPPGVCMGDTGGEDGQQETRIGWQPWWSELDQSPTAGHVPVHGF